VEELHLKTKHWTNSWPRSRRNNSSTFPRSQITWRETSRRQRRYRMGSQKTKRTNRTLKKRRSKKTRKRTRRRTKRRLRIDCARSQRIKWTSSSSLSSSYLKILRSSWPLIKRKESFPLFRSTRPRMVKSSSKARNLNLISSAFLTIPVSASKSMSKSAFLSMPNQSSRLRVCLNKYLRPRRWDSHKRLGTKL